MKILIVGAGIAGLTLANVLEKGNMSVDVIEKRDELIHQGSGIMLGLNAVMALDRVGLASDIEPIARKINTLRVTDEDEKIISQTKVSILSDKYKINTFAISREALHTMLIDKLKRTRLHLSTTILSMNYLGQKIAVHLSNDTIEHYDLVVGADGIHSRSRYMLLGRQPLRYSGYACWRFLFEHDALESEDILTEMWGKGKRLGIVPLGKKTGYCFATINTPQNNEKYASMTHEECKKLFSEFGGKAKWALDSLTDETNLLYDELRDQPDVYFGEEYCILIGDAAHAMTPNMGEGAAMAIEDAVLLGELLLSGKPNSVIFEKFVQKRKKKVKKVQTQSFKLGKIAQIDFGFGILMRNSFVKLLPSSLMLKSLESTLIEKGCYE